MAASFSIDFVKSWIAQSESIAVAPEMGGGWEYWAKYSLCLELLKQQTKARCEIGVYTGNQIADMIVKTGPPGSVHWDLIELKCYKRTEDKFFSNTWKHESLKTFFSDDRFAGDVQTIDEVGLKPEYSTNTATKWAVGFLTLQDVQAYDDSVHEMDDAMVVLKKDFGVGSAAGVQYTSKIAVTQGQKKKYPVYMEKCKKNIILIYASK